MRPGLLDKKTHMTVPAIELHRWCEALKASLRLTYLDPVTKTRLLPDQLKFGTPVIAHVEFDPGTVALMDAAIGRSLGSRVYATAFEACKKKADDLLDAFDEAQKCRVNRHMKGAIRRFEAFAGPIAADILK